VEVQPQLVLLQKTLLNIEGLGRQLDPDLDLWKTARPYLERWMNEQIGWRGLLQRLREESPRYSQLLPQLPRLATQALEAVQPHTMQENSDLLKRVLAEQKRTNLLLGVAVYFGGGLAVGVALVQFILHWYHLFE
jgi:ubiquinone biosynthesis protein